MAVYPEGLYIKREVNIGGLQPAQLTQKLHQQGIKLNDYAEQLLSDERFVISEKRQTIQTVELTIRDLSFSEGATMPQILASLNLLKLALCPIEVGPYLRLDYCDQSEGETAIPNKKHQAPSGSLTVASAPLYSDDDFPKGFYLRKIAGELWLRGYVADDRHIWNPDDAFVFRMQ